MNVKDILSYIREKQKEIFLLGGIISLLDWDQKTYMPRRGINDRSLQISILRKRLHEIVTSEEMWKGLEFLTKDENFDRLKEEEKIIVNRLKKDVEKARKIPTDFVERMSKAESLAYSAWEMAKKRSRFDIFQPHLEKIVELKREYCGYINIEGHIYNNLLDDYEEGMRYEKLKPVFDYLKGKLKKFLDKLEVEIRLNFNLSRKAQAKLSDKILKHLGLKRDRFRIDTSEHPFTTRLSTYDVRITTRYLKENPLSSLFSTLHEAGHALYKLNLPKGKFRYTVISDAPSLGLHESQSRFWENIVGRSYSFWEFFYPFLKEVSPGFENSLEDVYSYVNAVRRSKIRTDADEVSYNLHIILRFEIETGLMDEKIDVKDLPEIWNEKMEELLGIKPLTDREGVLQDMHWSTGDLGYFPSYTIGNIYSAQQMYAMRKSIGNFDDLLRRGDFKPIISWLKENIHSHGRKFTSEEIIRMCCGEGLNPEKFIRYLEEKFHARCNHT